MSTATVDFTDMNLGSVVKVLQAQLAQLEETKRELHLQSIAMEDLAHEFDAGHMGLANMAEEIPEAICGADAHATLVAVAEACASVDVQAIQEAWSATARAERGVAMLMEAVAAAEREFSTMQTEYADARVTDATAWHTEA